MHERHDGSIEARVSANQVVGELSQIISEIEANIRQRAAVFSFNANDTEELIGYMNDRTRLLVAGLLPADDYTILSQQIDKRLGSTKEVTYNATEFETCERAVKLSLDAIQGNMNAYQILSEEAKAELARRWPTGKAGSD